MSTLLALDTGVQANLVNDITISISGNDITEVVKPCTYYINYPHGELKGLFDVGDNGAGKATLIANKTAMIANVLGKIKNGEAYSTAAGGDYDVTDDRDNFVNDLEVDNYQSTVTNFLNALANKFTSGTADDGQTTLASLNALGIVDASFSSFSFADYRGAIQMTDRGDTPKDLAEELADAEDVLTSNGTDFDFSSLPDGFAFSIAVHPSGTLDLEFTVTTDTLQTGDAADISALAGQIRNQTVKNTATITTGITHIALRKYTPAV